MILSWLYRTSPGHKSNQHGGNSFTHLIYGVQFRQASSCLVPPVRLTDDTLLYSGTLFPVFERYEVKKDQNSIATCFRLPYNLLPSYSAKVSRLRCGQMQC